MDNFVKQYCRLCLYSKSNDNFEKISDFTLGSLDILLLKLDLDQNKHLICKVCALKVKEALTFKSMCLCTDNIIISHVDDETGRSVDLIEIYAEEKGRELTIYDLYGHKVCRLCMQLIKGKFMSVHEVEIEAIEKYIPEINFSVIKDPVICQQCFDSVETYSSFIKNCLEVEQKNKNPCNSKGSLTLYKISPSVLCIKTEDNIKQEEIECREECLKNESIVETLNMKVEDSIIKQENSEARNEFIDSKFNIDILEKNDACEIKTECIDIKSEEENGSDTNLRSSSTIKTVSETQIHRCLDCDIETASKSELENHIITFHKNTSLDPEESLQIEHDLSKEKLFQCDKCSFVSRHKSCLKKHQLRHMDPSLLQMYKCDKCSYETKFKYHLTQHQSKHDAPLQGQMYKCSNCSYETKFKTHLKYHQTIHKVPLEIHMYKCDECTFETKSKRDIKVHQLKHTNPPIEEMYQCDKCRFVTKYRSSLRTHQLVHEDPSQVEMYRCDMCNFETKRKGDMKKHESRHINPSGQDAYPCDKCSYVGACRLHLRDHQLIHKAPSRIYKCKECDFESRFRTSLTKHQLRRHNDIMKDVPTYKCDKCYYETKVKENMKYHEVKHRNPSKEELYQCDKCSYMSKYKRGLKQHHLKHKDPTDVQMYNCDKCSYVSKHKSSLVRHQLIHKDVMYKCGKCNFETKHKEYVKKHCRLVHKVPSVEETS